MTSERKPEDEQGGFETSSELRRDYPSPAPEPLERPRAPTAVLWLRWAIVGAVVVVLGFAIYFLVTSL
jgi:hypothetical protein